jgi:hypothetical protein
MDDDEIIKKGRFKGKRITFADSDRVEEFYDISAEFMEKIFELLPGEYLITDESDVADFTDAGSSDSSELWIRISEAFDIDRSELESGRFVNIFAEIARRRNLH